MQTMLQHCFLSPIQPKKRSWFAGLFDTHPPVKDRIKALEEMAR